MSSYLWCAQLHGFQVKLGCADMCVKHNHNEDNVMEISTQYIRAVVRPVYLIDFDVGCCEFDKDTADWHILVCGS